METSILHVNSDSFTGPLIIGTFEKRAPRPEMRPAIVSGNVSRDAPVSHWPIFSLSQVTVTEVSAQFLSRFLSVEFINKLRACNVSQSMEMCGSQNL